MSAPDITEDEWSDWRANAITKFVFDAFDEEAEAIRVSFIETFFLNSNQDPILMANMRGQYGAFRQMIDHHYSYLVAPATAPEE